VVGIVEKILKVFHDNNIFNEGVELIGSWCFQLYQKYLGAKSFPLRTQDIDFLIPHPYRGGEHKDFINKLEELGFTCDFNNDGSLYLWNSELKIEFITPQKGRGIERTIKVKELGISAIPLRFVSILLDNPITVKEGDINILIPNPVNFCIHKLIIASRRKKIEKSLKDLQQAIYTSVITDSEETRKLFDSLPKKWKQAILLMLERAKEELPLLLDDIENLELTLQKTK
jgi:hypothetical protein